MRTRDFDSADRFRESPDLVVVLGRLSGCGRTSCATIDAEGGIVITIRDRKMARLRGFLDRSKPAGLAE